MGTSMNYDSRTDALTRDRGEGRGALFKEKQVELDPKTWYLALTFSVLFLGIGIYYALEASAMAPRADRGEWFLLTYSFLVGLPLALGLFLPWWYFRRLQVRVTERQIEISFRLWQRRLIPIEQVVRWEVRVYHMRSGALRWRMRRKIRAGLHRVYAVNGIVGVQVELADGKKILIGSQHPERLAGALEKAYDRSREAIPAG